MQISSKKDFSKRYRRIEKIGEGTYGQVYKCRDLQYKEKKIVALKKIRLQEEDEGIPSTAVREVAILLETDHENIVKLIEFFFYKEQLYLVFEYLDMDLKRYMDIYNHRQKKMPPKIIKKFMYQMISALDHMHAKAIVHRDLKPQNVLVNKNNNTKICDFGLARVFNVPVRTYTHEVVTLWYRAPEILLGSKRYSSPVDIWSLGCIFVELIRLQPLFAGDSEIDEILKIFQILGTPTEDVWEGVTQLPHYNINFPEWKGNRVGYYIKDFDKLGIDLVEKMLVYDPKMRISARLALLHPFFDDIREKEDEIL